MEKEICANWLNFEVARQTVKEYEARHTVPEERGLSDLSDFNITKNCMECNMRPNLESSLETVAQIASLFKSNIMTKLESVGMKRKCFSPSTK